MFVTSKGELKDVSPIDIHEGILNIPYGTKVVATNAIYDLPQLTTLVIPETVETFERDAVMKTGIVHLVIPETVKTIAHHAFAHNDWLSIVEVKNPNTDLNGSCVFDCKSISLFKIGMVRYNVRCLKYNVCYQILSKKAVDIYTVYLVEPFKGSATIGKVFVAVKQGVCGDGVSIERAIEDCHRNYMTPSIIEQYKDITLDTLVDWYDYKRITGACDEGILEWMHNNGYKDKDKEKVRVLIEKLGTAYGASIFAQFVADRYADRMEGRK